MVYLLSVGVMTSLGFLSPLFLGLALPGLALLIYAYFRKGSGFRRIVPTVFLLRQIEAPRQARSRPNFPLRFFLELALLLALILGSAGLYRSGQGRSIAFLVDSSLSLAARTERGLLFDELKLAAEAQALMLSPFDQVSLFRCGPGLELINEVPQGSESLSPLFASLEPEFAEDQMRSCLESLLAKKSFSEIHVFSDRQGQNAKNSEASLVQWHQSMLEGERANLALGRVRETEEQGRRVLEVLLHSFGGAAEELELDWEVFSPDGRLLRAERSSPQRIEYGGSAWYRFRPKAQERFFRVRLHKPLSPAKNRIRKDDFQWFVSGESSSEIVLVSDFSSSELGLRALEERAPKLVSFEEFEGKRQSLLEEASAFIFHRQAPRGELSQKHAILVPKSGEAPYEADLEQNLRPSSWKELDPLLRYLQLADLEFPEAAIFRPQRADEILLSSRKGPLLLRRVSGKAEQILFGFDLFPYEASKSPVRSIFLLNLFSWLKEDSLGQSQSNLPYAQKSAGQARLLRGENDLLALSGEVNIREPGILFQDEESRALLLGFFSSQESNLEASLPIHYSSPETSSVAEESRQPLFSLLALLILGVFLADILLLLARPRRALLNRRSQQGVGS